MNVKYDNEVLKYFYDRSNIHSYNTNTKYVAAPRQMQQLRRVQ